MATKAWREAHLDKAKLYRREHYLRNRQLNIEQALEYKRTHPVPKVCNTCKISKPASDYRTKVQNGRTYLRYECNVCDNKRSHLKNKVKRQRPEVKESLNGRKRCNRRDPDQRAKFIVWEYRTADKKRDSPNDLDLPFVTSIIANGCRYCGDRNNLMVLDRIDNALGHTKDNVTPACFRCNNLRGNMPYDAWMDLVPAVRATFEKGLFGNWKDKYSSV